MSLSTIYFKQNDFIEAKNHLIKAIEIDTENIKYWELYCKICLHLNQFDEVEISFKEILSLGELNLSTLILLTKTVLETPNNNLLSDELLKRTENLTESLTAEAKYIRYVIYSKLGEIKKANFNLKEAYSINPAIYDYFRDIFPTIPQLHVFKNMNAS
jgi:tetratricopeptide (TPR) repeat protein